jgi:hypothetical protein
MDAAAFETWARIAVERAAGLVAAEIPEARTGPPAKGRRVKPGYVSRYVHFRHPEMPADRAVWLYAVPAGHEYDFKPAHDRVAAGLMQDPGTELDRSRFAAGLNNAFAWSWKTHIDDRYEGWRLALRVDPDSDAPDARGDELAEQVLRALRAAGLLPT